MLPRAVIAEDHILIQEALRLQLEGLVNVVATVEDGQAALEAVTQHRPEILFLDLSLPQLNGFAVAKRAKQSWPDLKLCFVTAQSDRSYIEEAFRLGARGYVLKGAITAELERAVGQVLAGKCYCSPLLARSMPLEFGTN